jgi:hypothetical protein
VAQKLTDFGQRGALAQHVSRHRVAQQMRAFVGRVQPSTLKGAANNAANCYRTGESAMGGSHTDEHLPAGTRGTQTTQVIG